MTQEEFERIADEFEKGDPKEVALRYGLKDCEYRMRMAIHNHNRKPKEDEEERQKRFDRVVHISRLPIDATKEEIEAGLANPLPWGTRNLNELYQGLAQRLGMSVEEAKSRMEKRNHMVFNDWLLDYAKRLGRPVDEVREEVLKQRKHLSEQCNKVAA